MWGGARVGICVLGSCATPLASIRLAVDILAARWMKVKLEWMHRVSFGV